MATHRLATLALALTLTACTVPGAPKGGTPAASTAGGTTTTKPGSARPSAGPGGATAAANLPDIPTEFLPPLAPSVQLVAAGGGNLVAAGGGNLVAAGGGNYRLAAEADLIEKTVVGAIKENVAPFVVGSALVAIVARAVRDRLLTGKQAIDKPFTDRPALGKPITSLLTRDAERWRLTFYEGEEASPETQVAAIVFTSRTQGEAVYRALAPVNNERRAMRLKFDLDAGVSTGDTIVDRRTAPFIKGIKRVSGEFRRHADAEPTAVATQLRMAGYFRAVPLYKDGVHALAANFLADGPGALVVGTREADSAAAALTPISNGPGIGFFVDARAQAVAQADASAGVKAILPTEADLPAAAAWPADPTAGDPFAAFGFSE